MSAEVQPAKAVYYDLALKAYDTQMQQIDQLDAKASAAFAAASGTLAIIAGLLAVAASSKAGFSGFSVAVFFVGLAVYILTASSLVYAYLVRDWQFGPDLCDVARETGLRHVDVIQDWIGDYFAGVVRHNKDGVENKAQFINYGLIGLLLESVVLAVAVGTILVGR